MKDTAPVANVNALRDIYRKPSCAGPHVTIEVKREDTHMDFLQANFQTEDPIYVMAELKSFRSNCAGTLSAELLTMVQGYMQSYFLQETKPDVYGIVFAIKKTVFNVTVKCSLLSPYICEVTVSKNIS